MRLLTEARRGGDLLVVGLNSDSSVRRLKGEGRPILSAADRAQVLGGLDAVDFVVVFDEDTPDAIIRGAQAADAREGGRLHGGLRGRRAVRAFLRRGRRPDSSRRRTLDLVDGRAPERRALMRAYFDDLATLVTGASLSIGPAVDQAARLVADAALSSRTTFAFGNGGSATQAQHFVAELVVRYKDDRPALPAVALTADIAILTACANDYDYSVIFARQIEALGKPGDVAVGFTTSGKSPNVLKALEAARARGLATIMLTGEKGRAEAARWDVGIVVPSTETAHVQELHLAALHLMCRFVDEERARRG